MGFAGILGLALLVLPALGTPGDPVEETVPADYGAGIEASAAVDFVPRTVVGIGPDGATFPSAPDLDPIPEKPTIRDVQLALRAGDERRALRIAEAIRDAKRWGRERHKASMVVGLLHRDAGRHNLASEAFTSVRVSKSSPLAEWAAFYEAEQDLARGKPSVAIAECKTYATRWPDGHFKDACKRIIARGHAERGHFNTARRLAKEYDKEHTKAPIAEQIDLALATWEVKADPKNAVDTVKELWLYHRQPLTGRVAHELMGQLAEDEVEGAGIPTDTASLKARAVSLRDSAARDEAWMLFEELVRRSEDDPALKAWLEDQAELFGWRCWKYDFLAERLAVRYAEKPDAELAWEHYRSLAKGGRWSEAADVGLAAMKAHGNTRRWYRAKQDVANALMLSKRYPEARDLWDQLHKRGGWRGRQAMYSGAFATYMAGELDDAETRLTAVIDKDRNNLMEARYWRARTYDKLGKTAEAEADRQWLRDADPYHWYSVLSDQNKEGLVQVRPFARNGHWPGEAPPELPDSSAPIQVASAPVAKFTPPRAHYAASAFSLLAWPMARPAVSDVAPVIESVVTVDPTKMPPHYRQSNWFDEEDAARLFRTFRDQHAEDFPVLATVYELASAGLYDWSGPLLAQMFEGWREAYNNRYHPQHKAAREVTIGELDWRQLFLFARDHNHATRFTIGLEKHADNELESLEALRLQHPLAHGRYVWKYSEQHGLDPYLIEALMRQESIYDTVAVSRVGARGAMQIMPRTGHLLADLNHDTEFTAGNLEDPVLAVGRGVDYLGQLMTRFDGVYPIAVASYNGGPHNMSRFLRGTGYDMPIDAWVEHIPFRESKNYVRRVTRRYAMYLAFYEDGAHVVVPEVPKGDHPEVVNF